MLEGRALAASGHAQVVFAGCVQSLGKPFERLSLIDHSLKLVTQRAWPVDCKCCAEFVSEIDGVLQTRRGVGPHLRRFRRRARRPDGMKKSLARDHRAAQPIFPQGLLQTLQDFRLAVRHEGFGGNHVGIVCGPIADADFGELMHHFCGRHRFARGRMKQGLTLIRCGPLRSADVIFAARLG